MAISYLAPLIAVTLVGAPGQKQSDLRRVVNRPSAPVRPNIVLIMTDDQGAGDVGIHGNPWLQTSSLDRLAREGIQFQYFYVSPVCSPTRASLLTGRYNYRTGVIDTYRGRSLMHGDETTLAEMLSSAGYRTAIFGKWHLGDNYPLRAMDQGFQESLTLNGGGIGQTSDPPEGKSYFDPVLRHNGTWVKMRGYVSDVITDEAIKFIRRNRQRQFFAYVAFNAPHTPLEVPPQKYAKYRAMDLGLSVLADRGLLSGHPIAKGFDADTTAKIYGMVENIDDNVGRLLSTLEESELDRETVVIFMTDNGPQQPRYNVGMLQLKGSVHEGGVRVPMFMRWPGRWSAPRRLDRVVAHIDVTPTVLDICGVPVPKHVRLDGRSLLPLLEGTGEEWPDRTLYLQWHRGDVPEFGRAFAARSQQYKLVQPLGYADTVRPSNSPLLLFDMAVDPFEERNIAASHREIVDRMWNGYGAWFRDVTSGRDYTDAGIARIALGSPSENPVRLTRQDWRGPRGGASPEAVGYWQVHVRRAGIYTILLRLTEGVKTGVATFSLGDVRRTKDVQAGAITLRFERLRLAAGAGTLTVEVAQGHKTIAPLDVTITRLP